MPLKEHVRRVFKCLTTIDKITDKSKNSDTEKCDENKFIFVRTIGTGSFGRVFLAKVKNSSEVVAIKRLEKLAIVNQKQTLHINTERLIVKTVKHPFIVNYRGSYKDLNYLYLVLEFVPGGEFFRYMRKMKRLCSDHSRFYAACVTEAIRYLHSLNIIFRDLKPENLLLMSNGYLKLTDFGFAKILQDRTYTLCGTPEYVAPELLLNKGHGKSVDWWTLGILIYEMIAGYTPFGADDVMTIYQKILDGSITFPRGFNSDAKSLIKHLLAHDLSRRYGVLAGGASDVINHRFLAPINFTQLVSFKIPAPYIPSLQSEVDDSKFAIHNEVLPEVSKNNVPDSLFADW